MRDRLVDELLVGHGREVDQPRAVAHALRLPGRHLARQPRLAEPPAPVSVTRRATSSRAAELVELPLPSDEAGELERQVVAADALERREVARQVGMGELEQLLRALEVAQAVQAEVSQACTRRQVLAGELADGTGHEDLAVVRERANPSAPVERGPAPVGGVRRAGVEGQSEPRPVLALHGALDVERAGEGVGRAREHRPALLHDPPPDGLSTAAAIRFCCAASPRSWCVPGRR